MRGDEGSLPGFSILLVLEGALFLTLNPHDPSDWLSSVFFPPWKTVAHSWEGWIWQKAELPPKGRW